MSALDFLSPDRAVAGLAARSPMAREAAAAGARVEVRDGWEVAVDYGDRDAELRALAETVAFVDRSQLGTIELQGAESALDALPGTGAPGSQDGRWLRVTPMRALVLCEPAATAALRERLERELAGHALDVTAAYAKLVVAGPLAREAIARFCALDLRPQVTPVGVFRPGSVARTPGAVLREADERYVLLFGAAYGGYMWSVVADAVGELGGRAAGADALARAQPARQGAWRDA